MPVSTLVGFCDKNETAIKYYPNFCGKIHCQEEIGALFHNHQL